MAYQYLKDFKSKMADYLPVPGENKAENDGVPVNTWSIKKTGNDSYRVLPVL